jgi:hypothetical protein
MKHIETNFPETLFVKEEDDGEDGRFFVASEDAGDHAERGVAVPAAEYRLVRAGVVVETTKFEMVPA